MYNGNTVTSVGNCELECKTSKKKSIIEFQVIDLDVQPILGAETCLKEGLIIINDCEIFSIQPR